jgi:hypothetical protein
MDTIGHNVDRFCAFARESYNSSTEFVIRLIRDQDKIEISDSENNKLSHINSIQGRQYLVKRKTYMIFCALISMLSLVSGLVAMIEIDYSILDDNIAARFKAINAFIYLVQFVPMGIILYMIYHWNAYTYSSNGSIGLCLYILFGQSVFLWLPYFNILGGQYNLRTAIIMSGLVSTLIINMTVYLRVFDVTYNRIKLMLIKFPNINEFRAIQMIITICSIPSITLYLVVLFQIAVIYKDLLQHIIPIVWIAYITKISGSLISVVYRRYRMLYQIIYVCELLVIGIYLAAVKWDVIINILNTLIHNIPNLVEFLIRNVLSIIVQFRILHLIIDDLLIVMLRYLKKEQNDYRYYIYELNGNDQDMLIPMQEVL